VQGGQNRPWTTGAVIAQRAKQASNIGAALENARRAYNKLYPKLSLLFDSKSYIETFFVDISKPGKTNEEAEEESTQTETAQ
jgi:hypothetical protein